MTIPVRCFSCGKIVGNKWERYTALVTRGVDPCQVLDSMGIVRLCCRRMLVTHVDKTVQTQSKAPVSAGGADV